MRLCLLPSLLQSRVSWLAAALLMLAPAAPAAADPATNDLVVLSWNVENLFDTADDPANPSDDEFTPNGWKRWTDVRYRAKLRHLAETLTIAAADIVCVAEIENRKVLEDLAEAVRAQGGPRYAHVTHREGQDERGIDVAMLSVQAPRDVHWLSPAEKQRDILVATFGPEQQPLTILANHWKSRWGKKAESDAIRWREAKAARAEVDRILAAKPDAAVMLMGDFNDNFDGPFISEGLRSVTNLASVMAEGGAHLLYNLHNCLAPDQRGTLFYEKAREWNSFDTVNVSRSMLLPPDAGPAGWRVKPGSYSVLRIKAAANAEGQPLPFRNARNPDTGQWAYQEGYSDHFPVRVTLCMTRRNRAP